MHDLLKRLDKITARHTGDTKHIWRGDRWCIRSHLHTDMDDRTCFPRYSDAWRDAGRVEMAVMCLVGVARAAREAWAVLDMVREEGRRE